MNKGVKFGIVFVILLLITNKLGSGLSSNRKKMFEAILKKYGQKRLDKFQMVYNALKALNLTELQFKFVLAQIMVETGMFIKETGVFEKNTNASGITWSGSVGQRSTGATQGTARPTKEGKGTFYAKYPNLTAWAKDYMRILNKGSYPLKATSIKDYVHRLKLNKYFADPEAVYLKNATFYYNLIQD